MTNFIRWLKKWPDVEDAWLLPISVIAGVGMVLSVILIAEMIF